MRCKDAKKMMYWKQDEMTFDERRQFDAHLTGCEMCRAERRLFDKQLSIVNAISQKPAMDGDVLTDDVMRSIQNMARYSKMSSTPFDKLLDLFALKSVRLAFAACIVFVIGLFFTQEMIILNRLNALEQRLEHASPATLIQFAGSPKSVLSLLSKKEDHVVINKEVLEEFLKSYGELQIKNRVLLRALQEQAEQSNITWQDGLTDGELESLLESETIQQKLKEL